MIFEPHQSTTVLVGVVGVFTTFHNGLLRGPQPLSDNTTVDNTCGKKVKALLQASTRALRKVEYDHQEASGGKVNV